jgi:hypothetical protein
MMLDSLLIPAIVIFVALLIGLILTIKEFNDIEK